MILNRQDINATHQLETRMEWNADKELEIYDFIVPFKFGEDDPAVTDEDIDNSLKDADGDVTVRINSKGGEIGTAMKIYNRLDTYNKGKTTAIVDGFAFSCAGWLPMACDERKITSGGIWMVHNPRIPNMIASEKDIDSLRTQYRAARDSILNIFEEKLDKISREEMSDLMEQQTYMNAKDTVERGIFHSIHEGKAKLEVLNAAPPDSLPPEFITKKPVKVDARLLLAQRERLGSKFSIDTP